MPPSRPSAASTPPSIDTTPLAPRPPEELIVAASRAIPPIFAELQSRQRYGPAKVDAEALAYRLKRDGHNLASAQWAIHESVAAGRLKTEVRIIGLPAFSDPSSFPSKGRAVIPKQGPTPFDRFTLLPTEILWEWWRNPDNAPAPPAHPPSNSPPVNPIDARISLVRSAVERINRLGERYRTATHPVRKAMTTLATIDHLCRPQWPEAFLAVAARLKESEVADEAEKQINAPLWNDLAGRKGQGAFAVAGRAFCEALAKAIRDGSQPDDFLNLSERYSFVVDAETTRAISCTLARIEEVLSAKAARRFGDELKALLSNAGYDDPFFFKQEAEGYGLHISDDAERAIGSWETWVAFEALERTNQSHTPPSAAPASPASAPAPPAEPAVVIPPMSIKFREFMKIFEDFDAARMKTGPFAWKMDGSPGDAMNQMYGRANHESYLATLRGRIDHTPGHEELRAYTLKQWGEELSLPVLARVKGELLRRGLAKTPSDLEAMTVERVALLLSTGTAPPSTQTVKPSDPESDSLAVLRVYTNGAADERIEKITKLVANTSLTVEEKLSKMDALIPIPHTASAEQLGEMLTPKVSKQAVMKSDWWQTNRKGEKALEVGRRRAGHQARAQNFEPPGTSSGK